YTPHNTSLSVGQIYQTGVDTFMLSTWYGGLQQMVASGRNVQVTVCPDEGEKNDRKWIVQAVCPSSSAQHMWVATYGNGLALYDPGRRRFAWHARHDVADPMSLCSDLINVILRDSAGTLWVGTDEGLDKYDTLSNRFSMLTIPALPGTQPSRQHVVDLIGDRN